MRHMTNDPMSPMRSGEVPSVSAFHRRRNLRESTFILVRLGIVTFLILLAGAFSNGATSAMAWSWPWQTQKKTQTISVNAGALRLAPKSKKYLAARTSGDGKLTFYSSNVGVAGVDRFGYVVSGTPFFGDSASATITIKAAATSKYKEATRRVTVTVTKKDTKITTRSSSYSCYVGQSFSLGARTDSKATLSYSSYSRFLRVTSSGRVTGLNPGDVSSARGVITITSPSNATHKKATKNVTVTVKKKIPSIKVIGKPKSCHVGDTFSIKAYATSGGRISYTASPGWPSTIIHNGVVTANKAGTLKITISVAGTTVYKSAKKTVSVSVRKYKPKLTVGKTSYSCKVGETIFLNAKSTSNGRISYSVRPSGALSVSWGCLRANKAGKAYVTVSVAETAKYESVEKTVPVRVNRLTPTLTVIPSSYTLRPGDSFSLSAYTTSNGKVTYSVSNTSLLSIKGRRVTAKNPGDKSKTSAKVIIKTATTDKYVAAKRSIPVTILKDKPTITARQSSYIMEPGDSVSLGAKSQSNGKLSYSSSSPFITVSASGLVSAKDIKNKTTLSGTVTIKTAATKKYVSATKKVSVTIKKYKPTISTSSMSYTCASGKSVSLGASSSSKGKLSYSSDSSYLTVSGSGVAKAKDIGNKSTLSVTVTISCAPTKRYVSASKKVTVVITNEYNGSLNMSQRAIASTAARLGSTTKIRPSSGANADERASAMPGSSFSAYISAHQAAKPYIDDVKGIWDNLWASCDAGAASVIQSSGADRGFPGYDPAKQYNHCMGSSLWKSVGTWSYGDSCSNLQPGDVLISPWNSQHIKIYVGNEAVRQRHSGSGANMFAASYGDYYPYLYNESYSSDSRVYTVFRHV